MNNASDAMKNAVVLAKGQTISQALESADVKNRFREILGSKAAGFMSSILTATQLNPRLATVDPQSVIAAAAIAASLDLPINPSLGFAHIVPYGERAQFQIGWKGFIQLAMRSGQYHTMNLAVVHEGEIKKMDPFTGEIEFDAEGKKSNKAVGFVLFFELINGYRKFYYMTREAIEKHGQKYSKTFGQDSGQWKTNFEAMALKTVAKLGLSKYGIMSIEMQKAMTYDQATVDPGNKLEYADGHTSEELSAAVIAQRTAPAPAAEPAGLGDPDTPEPGPEAASTKGKTIDEWLIITPTEIKRKEDPAKKWVKTGVRDENHVWYSTFDTTIAATLTEACAENLKLRIKFVTTDKGYHNLTAVEVA